ncbi:hypothetical protein HA466_0100150 [Hirschfeldia incana]|nr:hypothetical protein HA466_0100150 [Hirschfeldia incana]
MIMKKPTQAFVLLSLLHILLCLSFQIRVTDARLRHISENRSLISTPPSTCVKPSPPCRAPLSTQAKPCVTVPRPPRKSGCTPSQK